MKITISRRELKDLVSGFSKIIPHRPTLAVLGMARFDVGRSNRLVAQATDLDQAARYQFDQATVDGSGSLIAPFATLKELAKGADSETIELEAGPTTDEKATVIIVNNVGGHALRQTVDVVPLADFPQVGPEVETGPADGFLPTYRRLAPFASSDQTRRVLNSVFVDLSGTGERNATLVACDGRRLTCCNSFTLPIKAKNGVVVPITKFLTWPGLGDEATIGTSSKRKCVPWFGLKAGPWTYCAKTVDGIYPNWRQVIPGKEDMVHQFAFTDADVDAMKKLLPAFPGKDEITLIGTTSGVIALAGKNAGDKTETSADLTAGSKYQGKGIRASLNRFYLLDAFAAGFRNFGFMDSYSPLRSEDKGAIHVLMPLRIGADAPESAPKPATNPAPAEPATNPTPAAETPPEPPKETKTMPPETTEPTALDKLQAAYETAKAKIREANQALADVAEAIKLAAREDRQRRTEVENVRAGLQKLQAIKV
jgi:DNA polymerase III sliding clamp (beta) subunit (PCNA family)